MQTCASAPLKCRDFACENLNLLCVLVGLNRKEGAEMLRLILKSPQDEKVFISVNGE